jgi:hypothetical protein
MLSLGFLNQQSSSSSSSSKGNSNRFSGRGSGSEMCLIGFAFLTMEQMEQMEREESGDDGGSARGCGFTDLFCCCCGLASLLASRVESTLRPCFRSLKYVHVETVDISGSMKSISIVQGRTVHEEYRQFSKQEYKFVKKQVSRDQYDRYWAYLRQHVGKSGFNDFGLRWNFTLGSALDCPYDAGGERFFCSELIASALVHAGIVNPGKLRPCTTSKVAAHKSTFDGVLGLSSSRNGGGGKRRR